MCPIHAVWEEAQQKMMEVLARTSIAELVKGEAPVTIPPAS
jgi:DNA-binding IscR family transcriptional regulator